MPHVSVVTSTYNRRAMLLPAVHTALGQRGVDHEVIVVDNGSSDGTSEALAAIGDPRLRVLRNPESLGPTGGRNTGLAAARGRWVGILDDDDLWAPDKLARQLREAERTGRHWVYSGCVYIDDRRRIIGGQPPLPPDEVVRRLPHEYVIPGGMSNMVWRRDRLDGDGLLDERLTMTADWDVALRLLRQGPPAMVSSPDVGYRQHQTNVSKGAAGFQHELDLVERKFGDLSHGTPVDRGAQWRFVASEALRAGDRRGAVAAYRRAIVFGDLGSLSRAASVVAPRRSHPWLRRHLLSDAAWMREAGAWLAGLELGPSARWPRVLIVQRSLRRYREPFYEQLRSVLHARGVDVSLLHSNSTQDGGRSDPGQVPWARDIRTRTFGPKRTLIWQPCLSEAATSDLVVVEQASKLLVNYVLLARRRLRGGLPGIAFWGHGRAQDQESASGVGEAVKRWLSRRVDWWFAYTEEVRDVVAGLGFPLDRITSVDNATDTSTIASLRASVTSDEIAALREELTIGPGPVGLYVGNLEPVKQMPLLLETVELVRRRHPDFQLVVVGDGPDRAMVERRASTDGAAIYAGQRFGRSLVALAGLADLMLVPASAGLVIVDAFALGVPPVVSDAFPHGPERAYVVHGQNGVVTDAGDASGLADVVADALDDRELLAHLVDGCQVSARRYTIEHMAASFADGVVSALGSFGVEPRG